MKSIVITRQLSLQKIQRRAYRMSAILLIGGGLIWAISAALSPAHAQGVYRIVGPDGKVTFSDQPPREPARVTPVTPGAPAAGGSASSSSSAGSGPQIPYEVRQVSNRYPVVLYAQDSCSPCNVARTFLSSRGVPYVEKSVASEEDVREFNRLFNSPSLPSLTIGRQQLVGFSETEWAQYLDAAGYPKTSQLPNGYRNGAKSPLVAKAAVTVPNDTQVNTAPSLTPLPAITAPPAPTPSNPAGISF